MTITPIPHEDLCRVCDPESLGFSSTASILPSDSIPGQNRAIEALLFGAAIKREGYNIYLAGESGLGKRSMAMRLLGERANSEAPPQDWVYVHNFITAPRPNAIGLPPGKGIVFQRAMLQLVKILKEAIPRAFESDDYKQRLANINDDFQNRQTEALDAFRKKAKDEDIAVIRSPSGFALPPIRDGQVMTGQEFEKLSAEEKEKIQKKIQTLEEELQLLLMKVPQWEQEHQEKVQALNEEITSFVVTQYIDNLLKQFADLPEIVSHLQEVQKDLIANIFGIMQMEQGGDQGAENAEMGGPIGGFNRYTVNLIVNHNKKNGAPVIFEDNPTLGNLIGRAEHISHMGTLITDFRLIRSGSMHRANGGYLIIDAQKLLSHPFSWDSLKRCLRGKRIKIESAAQLMDMISTVSLVPEPIPLDIKVVLVGSVLLYDMLCRFDPEFRELFKVVADFDDRMPRTPENQVAYASLLAGTIQREKLKPFTKEAVARVIEESIRLTGDSEKISNRLVQVADLLREADFHAETAGAKDVERDHVQQAINAQERRLDRVRERLQENINRHIVLIDTDGQKTGQINGLSVLQTGSFMFGQPTRISCRVRPGEGKIIDIEREVELGGPLHSKGVLILSGFLGAKFTLDIPLSLQASLVFEQSYGGVDGDSASSAELYALLSALADAPIRQGLAVTGSVNQYGDVQAIGGVNQKIEGFFDICRIRGLTGQQGALVPASNVPHLMLRHDVIAAVKDGKFNIYPVAHIDEGIELLTGLTAGSPNADGLYPEDTVFGRVQARLKAFAETRRRFMRPEPEGTGKGK
ncbi:Lon protease family protein [Sneathiella chinensis]|uniref:endopeptidase La n=1 Tax=Sneathiella chinensis TaxID=349750 RepID=A0ABQ5TYE7_9PROT|nr:AAA family ATPase [Sneathiella chinensis]GLQ04800.1 ATP-dependent protease [Sneathiella chinensis]